MWGRYWIRTNTQHEHTGAVIDGAVDGTGTLAGKAHGTSYSSGGALETFSLFTPSPLYQFQGQTAAPAALPKPLQSVT